MTPPAAAPRWTYAYEPAFGMPIGPWHRWFAWRPVWTRDCGWVWLKSVIRCRHQTLPHLDGPTFEWWERRLTPPPVWPPRDHHTEAGA